MTSRRDVLEGRLTDELGRLIRSALQERVAGAAPSRQAWEHIQGRVEREAVLRQTRQGFSSFLGAVVAWLSVDTCLPLFMVQPAKQVDALMWGCDMGWTRLFDQRGMMVQLDPSR